MILKSVILGCGQIAGGYDLKSPPDSVLTHVKALKNRKDVEVVGAFDINATAADNFAKTWNIKKAYTNLRDLMEECKPEIVSICTPNNNHYEAFKLVSQYKPQAIICEKPIALNSRHAEEMIEISHKSSIVLAVNYMRQWDTELTKLKKRIPEFGKLQSGKVLYTKGVFHNASHGINILQSWFGKIHSPQILRVINRTEEDFLADFGLTFGENSLITFQALDANKYNYFEIELNFENARIILPGGGAEIQTQKATNGVLESEKQITKGSLNRAIQNVIDNVVETIQRKTELKMTAAQALDTLKACEFVKEKII